MMLVPGARVIVQKQVNSPPETSDVLVRDLRSKERHFLQSGTQALVIGVDFTSKDKDDANVSIFVPNHGFFLTTTNWVMVVWSPCEKWSRRKVG